MISTESDLEGDTITLVQYGARMTMSLQDAESAIKQLSLALDSIYAAKVAAHQRDALYLKLNSHE